MMVLMVGALIACSAAIVRLIVEGLVPVYPLFTAWLGAVLIESAILVALPRHPDLAVYIWIRWDFVVSLLQIGAVAELYRRVLKHYKGIGSFGYWICAGLLAIAAAAVALTLNPDLAGQPYAVKTFIVIKRVVNSISTVFLMLMTLTFFVNLKVPIRANVAVHCYTSTVYFATMAVTGLFISYMGGSVRAASIVNTIIPLVNTACFLVWGLRMTQQGEDLETISLDEAQRQQLIAARKALLQGTRDGAHMVRDSLMR